MEVMIVQQAESVAERAAIIVAELLQKRPRSVLGLATGGTPIALYQKLIEMQRKDQVSFQEVCSFNLDEYYNVPAENKQSYRYYMQENFFSKVDIKEENTFFPCCNSQQNPRLQGALYEQNIVSKGGIDLQVLGIGSNGHIGFNEPGSSLASRTRIKTLAKSTIEDNSRFFSEQEEQPQLAMTMGIGTILTAKKILLIAFGEQKSHAIAQMIEGHISSQCPASALQLHQDVCVIVDRAAASQLQNTDYYCWSEQHQRDLVKQYGVFD